MYRYKLLISYINIQKLYNWYGSWKANIIVILFPIDFLLLTCIVTLKVLLCLFCKEMTKLVGNLVNFFMINYCEVNKMTEWHHVCLHIPRCKRKFCNLP